MEEKYIKTDNLLILKNKSMMKFDDSEFLRKSLVKQVKEGVVIIPSCLEIIAIPEHYFNDVSVISDSNKGEPLNE